MKEKLQSSVRRLDDRAVDIPVDPHLARAALGQLPVPGRLVRLVADRLGKDLGARLLRGQGRGGGAGEQVLVAQAYAVRPVGGSDAAASVAALLEADVAPHPPVRPDARREPRAEVVHLAV